MSALQQALLGYGAAAPSMITSGLQFWGEARMESGYADNDSVGTVTDQSGNGYNATSSNANEKPTYKTGVTPGGYAAFDFDGGQDFLGLGSGLGLARNQPSLTIYAIAATDTIAAGVRVLALVTTGASAFSARARLGANVVGGALHAGGRRLDADSFSGTDGAAALSTGTFYRFCAVFDWANSNLDAYLNNVSQLSNSSFQTDGNTSDTDSVRIRLGATDTGNASWDGKIAGWWIYRGAHDSAQRAQMDAWLATRI